MKSADSYEMKLPTKQIPTTQENIVDKITDELTSLEEFFVPQNQDSVVLQRFSYDKNYSATDANTKLALYSAVNGGNWLTKGGINSFAMPGTNIMHAAESYSPLFNENPSTTTFFDYAWALPKGIWSFASDTVEIGKDPWPRLIQPLGKTVMDYLTVSAYMQGCQYTGDSIQSVLNGLESLSSYQSFDQTIYSVNQFVNEFFHADGPKQLEMATYGVASYFTGKYLPPAVIKLAKAPINLYKYNVAFPTKFNITTNYLNEVRVQYPIPLLEFWHIRTMQKGKFIWAITTDGKLLMSDAQLPPRLRDIRFHEFYFHSELTGGKSVFAAGEGIIQDYKITLLNSKTGHYKVSGSHLHKLVEEVFIKNGYPEAKGIFDYSKTGRSIGQPNILHETFAPVEQIASMNGGAFLLDQEQEPKPATKAPYTNSSSLQRTQLLNPLIPLESQAALPAQPFLPDITVNLHSPLSFQVTEILAPSFQQFITPSASVDFSALINSAINSSQRHESIPVQSMPVPPVVPDLNQSSRLQQHGIAPKLDGLIPQDMPQPMLNKATPTASVSLEQETMNPGAPSTLAQPQPQVSPPGTSWILGALDKLSDVLTTPAAADTQIPNKNPTSIPSKSDITLKMHVSGNTPTSLSKDAQEFSNQCVQQLGIPKDEADKIANAIAKDPKFKEHRANLKKGAESENLTKPGLTPAEVLLIGQAMNSMLNELDHLAVKLDCRAAHIGISVVQGLASIGMGIAACMTPGMTIVGIPMLVSGIFKIGFLGFGDGPNPTQQLSEQINRLGIQVNELKKFVAEQFEVVYKNQKEIMKAIAESLTHIITELHHQIGGMRADTNYRFTKLQESINYLIKLTSKLSKEATLRQYSSYKTQVDDVRHTRDRPSETVPELSAQLYNWTMTNAIDSTLNGAVFAEDVPDAMLNQVLSPFSGCYVKWMTRTPEAKELGLLDPYAYLLIDSQNTWTILYLDMQKQSVPVALAAIPGISTILQDKHHEQLTEKDQSNVTDLISAYHQVHNLDIPTIASLTGFLASYYQLATRDMKDKFVSLPPRFPNLQIWFDGLQTLLSLHTTFFEYALYDERLESLKQLGAEYKPLSTAIADDREFWQYMIDEYYNRVAAVKASQDEYIVHYTNEARQKHNKKYQREEDKLATLDFFASPEDFIKQFDPAIREIAQLENDKVSGPVELKGSGPLVKIIRENKLVTATQLAAEYFFVESKFSAVTSGGPKHHSSIDLSGKYQKDAYFKLMGRGHWKDHNEFIEGRIGPEYLREIGSHITIERKRINNREESIRFYCNNDKRYYLGQDLPLVKQWTLPMELHFRGSVIRFNAHGNYEGHKNLKDDFWVEAHVWTDKRIRSDHRWRDNGTDNGTGAKLRAGIPDFIKKKWGENAAITIDTIVLANNDAAEKENIKKHFAEHRKKIATALANHQEEGERQKILNTHKDNLLKLAVHGNLLKCLIYFIGKDLSATAFAQLITPKTLQQENETFRKTLDGVLCPSLIPEQDITKRLQPASIGQLPDLSEDKHPHHPKHLHARGVKTIESYKQKRDVFRLNLPDFARFYDIKAFQAACHLYLQEFFTQESYEQFRELYQFNFQEAKIWIEEHDKYFTTKIKLLDVNQFRIYFRQITQWGYHFSKRDIVTGVDKKIKFPVDFSDQGIGQQVKLVTRLERGWESNLYPLMQLANQFSGTELFSKSSTAINFIMWGDSLETYARLIFLMERQWEYAAIASGTNAREQLNMLDRLLGIGMELRNLMVRMLGNEKLFSGLFVQYEAELRQLPLRIETLVGTLPLDKRDALLRQAFNDPYDLEGNAARLFGKFAVLYYCILNYGEMLLGYSSITLDELTKLPHRENLKAIFSDPESKDIPYQINKLIEGVSATKQRITEYLRSLSSCKIFFSTYWQKHQDSHILILDAADIGKQLSPSTLKMLDQFLSANPQITEMRLSDFSLTRENIAGLEKYISKYLRIRVLHFSTTDFAKTGVDILVQHPDFCQRLHSLKLTGNNLHQCMLKLSAVLNQCANLRAMDFSNTGINSNDLGILASALNDNFTTAKEIIYAFGAVIDLNGAGYKLFVEKIAKIKQYNQASNIKPLEQKYPLNEAKPIDINVDISHPKLDQLLTQAQDLRPALLKRINGTTSTQSQTNNRSSLAKFSTFSEKSSQESKVEVLSDSDDENDIVIRKDIVINNTVR